MLIVLCIDYKPTNIQELVYFFGKNIFLLLGVSIRLKCFLIFSSFSTHLTNHNLFKVDNIKLVYDNTTRTTRNNDGVLTRIPGFEEPKMSEFGDPFYTEWVDPSMASTGAYFKDIANTLATLGYKRNISIRGAPYDFRKAPSE